MRRKLLPGMFVAQVVGASMEASRMAPIASSRLRSPARVKERLSSSSFGIQLTLKTAMKSAATVSVR